MKNPTIATILNIIPGLGYVYLGGKRRLFGIMLLAAIVLSAIASADPLLYSGEYMEADFRIWDALALASLLAVLAAFMYDGYTSAMQHNADHKKTTKK